MCNNMTIILKYLTHIKMDRLYILYAPLISHVYSKVIYFTMNLLSHKLVFICRSRIKLNMYIYLEPLKHVQRAKNNYEEIFE